MSNEITQDEREQIINNIKTAISTNLNFTYPNITEVIGTDINNDKESWNKFLKLIESAPAKKNMQAVEFADKFEEAYNKTGHLYGAISECSGYDGFKKFGCGDVRKFCDAIRNLDAPEDSIPFPLDKDGVPCKIDDIVYYNNKEIWVEYCNSESIVYSDAKGDMHEIYAQDVTHKKPRTLEDIKDDALYSGLTSDSESLVLSLIDEAYELGQKVSEK